jgi:hypothetical protein
VEGLPDAASDGAASALYIFYRNREKAQITDPMAAGDHGGKETPDG